MCGIAGVFHLNGSPPERELLSRMATAMHHRGPDDEGFFVASSDFKVPVGPSFWER